MSNQLIPEHSPAVVRAEGVMGGCLLNIRHNSHGSRTPLSEAKLPPLATLKAIGETLSASLKKRTDAAQAADMVEILVGARAHAKMVDPDKYLRAIRALMVHRPPDVVAEAVHGLVTGNKFMPEPAEVETALHEAQQRRERLLYACREAWKEHSRRNEHRKRLDEIEAEKARNREDPEWLAWMSDFRAGRHLTFDQWKGENSARKYAPAKVA